MGPIILNSAGFGLQQELQILSTNASPAMKLAVNRMDPGVIRVWKGKGGKSYVTKVIGHNDNGEAIRRDFVVNAPALLRREDWLKIDRQIQWQAKKRLRLWKDIYSANPYDIPDGMGTMAIQHAIANGDASAIISMDAIRKSERSRTALELVQLPVPIISSDGEFGLREMAASRNSGMPLDTTNIMTAGRKIGETLEQMCIGSVDPFTFVDGTGSIYGATNFPQRLTASITNPESYNGTTITPTTTVNEILSAILQLELKFYYGPYMLYYSNKWGQFMDRDYSTQYSGETLRTRLAKISKIEGIATLDYLSDYTILLVQMTPDVVDGVNGMEMQTVQWEENGGFSLMFKVLCINFPRFRYDSNRATGIIHLNAGVPSTTTTTTTTTTTS